MPRGLTSELMTIGQAGLITGSARHHCMNVQKLNNHAVSTRPAGGKLIATDTGLFVCSAQIANQIDQFVRRGLTFIARTVPSVHSEGSCIEDGAGGKSLRLRRCCRHRQLLCAHFAAGSWPGGDVARETVDRGRTGQDAPQGSLHTADLVPRSYNSGHCSQGPSSRFVGSRIADNLDISNEQTLIATGALRRWGGGGKAFQKRE